MPASTHIAPYFDEARHAWVLTTYADVSAALRNPLLFLAGPRAEKPERPPDRAAHKAMREETRDAVAAPHLEAWRSQLEPLAIKLIAELNIEHSVELVARVADPLCLAAAALITEVTAEDAVHLRAQTAPISHAAADPSHRELRGASKAAQAAVAGCFHARAALLRDSGFVALAHTMPRLLTNAWLALLEHPRQWSLLHRHPERTPLAVEELLRHAGLTTTVFRRVAADTTINGLALREGDHLILRLLAANHDPNHFDRPDELDTERRESGHLSLGAGPHSCVGAPLIRMIAILATRPLVERFASATLTQPVELQGGDGFRSPIALQVQLTAS